MAPTRITVWLLLLGLAVALGGAGYSLLFDPDTIFSTWLYLGILAYDAGVFLLLLLDGALARRGWVVAARRELPARLSVGARNQVAFLVENRGGRPLHLLVRDETPPDFRVEPPLHAAELPAHTWVRLPYHVIPTERGDFDFGDVHVRCRGPLGLAWLDRALPAPERVQVYPNLLEVRRFEAMLRTSLVRMGGYHVKRIPGAGREFSHFRDYTVDDDYRHVSWKATARRAKPITAVHESEQSQDIIFCLDAGRMMAAKVGDLTKLDHAINAVLMLTHVSHRFQDNLGLLVFSHEVHVYLPPSKGRAQYDRFLRTLYGLRPELCYVNYREAFRYLVARHPKRALTMVFTDLLDAEVSSEYREAVRLLRRFHLPLTLAVADVPLRKLAARTPETPEDLYNVAVARDLLHGRAELLKGLEREGVMVVDTEPERLTVDAVNRYLALKTGVRI